MSILIIQMMGGILMGLAALVFAVSVAKVLHWLIMRRD
jgi:hypothetical protein